MSFQPMYCFSDAVNALLDYTRDNVKPNATRQIRRAIMSAYREIANAHRWTYLYSQGRVNLVAPYSTGTVEYLHTGGSVERQLTLTDGVWPTWSLYGTVAIGSVAYEVATRESDTVLQLAIASNPGEDLDAGTSYTIYRDTYTLPSDFVMSDEMVLEHYWSGMEFVHPSRWLQAHRFHVQTSSIPYIFTIRGDQNTFGCMAVSFYPTPSAPQTVDFIYERRPRQISVAEEQRGKITTTSGSVDVVGDGTQWKASMAGAVLRVSGDSQDYPTGPEGSNPARHERTVMVIDDATHLTVDFPIDETLTNVRHVVSDPIDCEYGAMYTAFIRCCEKELAISLQLKGLPSAIGLYRQALLNAREADSRYAGARSPNEPMALIPSALWHANNF